VTNVPRPSQRLQDQSPDLYARLQVLESKAHQLAEYSQGGANLTSTPHGLSHISTVEANYDWLLPDVDVRTFNLNEIYCLLGATLFHDVLMVPRREDRKTKVASPMPNPRETSCSNIAISSACGCIRAMP
jgi:hypothetical protein